MPKTDRKIAFVGCGYTRLTRKLEKPETELAIEACRMAAEDAGLGPADLDGINIQVHHYPPPETAKIIEGLGMRNVRWQVDGGMGIMSAVRAAQVLDAGACEAIVVCKIMNTVAPVGTPLIDPETGEVGGDAQFEVPYGLGYTMQRIGLTTRRYMHRYGITEEQVGWLAVVEREHALLNPWAYWKKPISVQDYLESRWIAEPVRLFDCDTPVNGAFAYILTRDDLARSLRHEPAYLLGWADSEHDLLSHHLIPEELEGIGAIGQTLYRDTGLSPSNMDVWMLYDGYSFFVLQWMENLGLVSRGEAGRYIEGGDRIRVTGEHPINPHGGQLSEGRLHGHGHILEAVQQVRGAAGERQARKADYAILSSAFPNTGSAAIIGKG